MKQIFKVVAQSDTFHVPSQKAEGGQISKCNIVLIEPGGKYENSYVATILGEQANIRFTKETWWWRPCDSPPASTTDRCIRILW